MIIKITYKKIIIIFLFLIFVKNLLSVDSHKNLLNILEYNFPLEITFEQTHRDEKINGWMVIYGNGMARTEFEPPNNNIIVAELVLLINILSAKSAHINICTGSTVAGS